MFTGIIEEMGKIKGIKRGTRSAVFEIYADLVLDGATSVGDSIALNGVCLTVTGISHKAYTVDVMNETLKRSNLGNLKVGSHVNLERAMPANGRFGGHIVSGHIDGCGTIYAVKEEENAVWYTVNTPSHLMKYIVEKGSVAIDGISLTVAYVGDNWFQVSTIPHTRRITTLSERVKGDTVNLECDILGKYVENMLFAKESKENSTNISKSFLAENGYL